MKSTYMRPGPASIALVLANMEDTLKKSGAPKNGGLEATWQHADFSLYASFIQENATILGKTAPVSYPQQVPVNSMAIDERDRNRFLNILSRVGRGHEGVSRQERLFVYQFWPALHSIFYKVRNA